MRLISETEFHRFVLNAHTKFRAGHFAEALAFAMKANRLCDGQSFNASKEDEEELYDVIGSIHLGSNNLEEARQWFERALSVQPESAVACAGLGEVFYLAELDQQAKTMFEWSLKSDPENAIALAGLQKVNGCLGLAPNHNTLFPDAMVGEAEVSQTT